MSLTWRKSPFQLVNEMFPMYGPAYTAKALMLNKQDKKQEAIDALEKAPQEIKGSSSELNYFLGTFYLDVGNLDKAREHADVAYRLG